MNVELSLEKRFDRVPSEGGGAVVLKTKHNILKLKAFFSFQNHIGTGA